MAFSAVVIRKAWDRQDGLCAACGKTLVFENYEKGNRGAWHAHHREPSGGDSLGNCAILCVNPPENCHLLVGHVGNFRQSAMLYDYDLPYLYAGRS